METEAAKKWPANWSFLKTKYTDVSSDIVTNSCIQINTLGIIKVKALQATIFELGCHVAKNGIQQAANLQYESHMWVKIASLSLSED